MMIGFFFSSLVKPESSAILVCSYGCSLLLNELLMLCLNLIYLAVANPPTHSNLRLQIISRPETTSYNIFFCSHSDCSCVSHFNFYNSFTDTELASSQSCSVIGSTISWIALWLLLTLTWTAGFIMCCCFLVAVGFRIFSVVDLWWWFVKHIGRVGCYTSLSTSSVSEQELWIVEI
jgi:hypothetical protein